MLTSWSPKAARVSNQETWVACQLKVLSSKERGIEDCCSLEPSSWAYTTLELRAVQFFPGASGNRAMLENCVYRNTELPRPVKCAEPSPQAWKQRRVW